MSDSPSPDWRRLRPFGTEPEPADAAQAEAGAALARGLVGRYRRRYDRRPIIDAPDIGALDGLRDATPETEFPATEPEPDGGTP